MKHSVLISLLWLAASVAVQSQTIPPSFLDKSVRTGFSTFTYYDIFGQPVTTMGGIISVNGYPILGGRVSFGAYFGMYATRNNIPGSITATSRGTAKPKDVIIPVDFALGSFFPKGIDINVKLWEPSHHKRVLYAILGYSYTTCFTSFSRDNLPVSIVNYQIPYSQSMNSTALTLGLGLMTELGRGLPILLEIKNHNLVENTGSNENSAGYLLFPYSSALEMKIGLVITGKDRYITRLAKPISY